MEEFEESVEKIETKEQPKLKKFLFRAFETHNVKDPVSLIFDIFYIIIILVAVVFAVIEVTELWERIEAFEIIEYIIVGIFAFEWFSMLYISDMVYPLCSRGRAMIKWIFSIESIIDIICLTIFIISMLPIEGMSREVDIILRFIALIKLIRLFKWKKYIPNKMLKRKRKHKPKIVE